MTYVHNTADDNHRNGSTGKTMLTRFLPFMIFPDNKPIPKYIQYLGKVLPYSVIGLLIVYCLKGVSWYFPVLRPSGDHFNCRGSLRPPLEEEYAAVYCHRHGTVYDPGAGSFLIQSLVGCQKGLYNEKCRKQCGDKSSEKADEYYGRAQKTVPCYSPT